MPATDPLSIDDLELDFDNPRARGPEIEAILPHRDHMRQLDAVVWWSDDYSRAVGIRDIKADEFWVSGHIPGRPLFPGVLMIESAAQLCSFTQMLPRKDVPFLGFTRCDDCVFRGSLVPGDRMIMVAQLLSSNRRRFISRVNGFSNDKLIFEVTITGMVM
ncbi:MAG: hypothetical protein MK085_06635 [Phycisphaerales bacterium]|nr:hypothetical protein [Phycisphaerales bacterium]